GSSFFVFAIRNNIRRPARLALPLERHTETLPLHVVERDGRSSVPASYRKVVQAIAEESMLTRQIRHARASISIALQVLNLNFFTGPLRNGVKDADLVAQSLQPFHRTTS